MKIYPSRGFRYARNDKQNSRHCQPKICLPTPHPRTLIQSPDLQPADASEFIPSVAWMGHSLPKGIEIT